MHQAFRQLFDQYVATGVARQLALQEALAGREDWQADIPAGTITFAGELTFPIQLLGTESDADQTWLWAWANTESELPPKVLRAAGWLREYGVKADIPELAEPSFPLDRADGNRIALLASGLTERCYYRGSYPGGALYLQLGEVPAQVMAPVRSDRIVAVLGQVIQSYEVDHRAVAENFLTQQGFAVQLGPQSMTGTRSGDSAVHLAFDDLGRISSMSTQLN